MVSLPKFPKFTTEGQKHRAYMVVVVMLSVLLGVALIAFSLRGELTFFLTPSELVSKAPSAKVVRLGGMVVPGSVIKYSPLDLGFALTDTNAIVSVRYRGMVPSLFREGQGVVVKGDWLSDEQVFIASELLAKHDERYMPPEVAKTVQGQYYQDRSLKVK